MAGSRVRLQQKGVAAGPSVSRRLLTTFALVSLVLITIVGPGGVAVGAQGPNQAGLVVDFGDGNVQTYCIPFAEDSISGIDLLLEAGLEVETGFNGGTICKVRDVGCPSSDCWCQCPGSPCTYWIYWRLNEGNWEYSQEGVTLTRLGNGDVDGWVWGEGAINAGGVQPPDIAFEDICVPPAADTPTPVPPPTATSTPGPTDTPKPTEDPELPTITHFTADRSTIYAGERVTLSWDLHDAQGAYLKVAGVEEGVVAPGSKTVSPATTTVYTLIARNDDGEVTADMTITVNPAAATPVPTASPLPTDTPVPANTATPTTSPPVTDTPPPTPVPVLANTPPATVPAHTPSPQPTATWLPVISPTPAAVAAATSALLTTRQLTPRPLVRDTAIQQQPAIPVIVLAVIGVIAVIGGLGGLLVIASTTRQGQRRR